MTTRLTASELNRLADAICARDCSLDVDQRSVTRAVYALLGDGQPITAARLAAAVGVEPARAAALLDSLPTVERDHDRAVVGFGGLTLHPTPNQLIMHRQVRYAWCAWDTLFLPVALDTEAQVTSRSGDSGRPVTLRVAPTGVLDRDPDGVALAFVHPEQVDTADLRASFCHHVRFLTDPTDTHDHARTSGRLVLDLDDAFELGRRMVAERCGPC
jgi:alkylmercury lyase